ncbi:MAG: PD40 domain-containing protein, partial [Flavobacteriaceae bacterium]|nr:PD40 domain-containing protein [Flavobacteriaceae bacterium]
MKKSILSGALSCLVFLLFSGQTTQAQDTRLLRNPSISHGKIAFLYAGDIWLSDLDGSHVKRITAYEGVEFNPRFSPDGKTIAFTGDYDGNMDVYTVPVTGGDPVRLTWHPGPDMVVDWTPDGKSILFASGRTRAPYADMDQLWTVSLDGTSPERFILPRAVNGQFSPDGKKFVYEAIPRWESEFRNYRGGQNNPLRIFDLESHSTEKLPFENSRDMDPVWMGDVIYFLSDRDHAMNVWTYDTSTKDLKQLSHFTEFDSKNLSGSDGILIIENGGYLYTLDTAAGGEPQKLSITVNGDFPWARPHWTGISKYIESAAISPEGKRAVLSARGDVFTVPASKGNYRNLTQSPGVADRAVAWSPDGQHISWFSDEGGEYHLVIADQFGNNPKKVQIEHPTFFYKPDWSPDSKYLTYYDANRSLWIYELSTGKFTHVADEGFAHPEHVIFGEWSPDSKWLAYTKRLTNEYSAIFIYSLAQNKSYQLTDGMSDCN